MPKIYEYFRNQVSELNSMYFEEIDPVDENGNNGDLYINTLTWNTWIKESDSWVLKGSIKANMDDLPAALKLIGIDVEGNPTWDGASWPGGVTGTTTVAWNEVTGKPVSSTTDIDDAVTKRHTHTNLTVLNNTQEAFTTELKNKVDNLSVVTSTSYVENITLNSTNWTEENNRFVQTIPIVSLQENDMVVADIDLTNALTFENEMLLIEQYQKIYRSVSWEGNIKFFAIESLNMNIDIKLLITKND